MSIQRHLHAAFLASQILSSPRIDYVVSVRIEIGDFAKVRRHRPRRVERVEHRYHDALRRLSGPELCWIGGVVCPVWVDTLKYLVSLHASR